MPQRTVLFDVFDTLVHLENDEDREAPYEVLAEWLAYHGIFATAQALRTRRAELIDVAFSRVEGVHPDIDMAEVYRLLLSEQQQATGVAAERLAVEAAIVFRIASTVELTLLPGVREALDVLGARVRLGIVSNTQRVYTEAELQRFDLLHYFETVVFSSDVLACKPSRHLFDRAFAAMEVGADDVIFVGDSPVDDVAGAAAVGIGTVLIDWQREDPAWTEEVRPLAVLPVAEWQRLPAVLQELGW